MKPAHIPTTCSQAQRGVLQQFRRSYRTFAFEFSVEHTHYEKLLLGLGLVHGYFIESLYLILQKLPRLVYVELFSVQHSVQHGQYSVLAI